MAKTDINEIRELEDFKIKILKILTQDVVITKDSYKIETIIENGVEVKHRVFAGDRAINCKKTDWLKGDKLYRGNASRERVRLVLQEIRKIAKEGRRYTLELDKLAQQK